MFVLVKDKLLLSIIPTLVRLYFALGIELKRVKVEKHQIVIHENIK